MNFLAYTSRILADVLPIIIGRTLTVPLGAEIASIRITPQMRTVGLSLRTRDPAEAGGPAKMRRSGGLIFSSALAWS